MAEVTFTPGPWEQGDDCYHICADAGNPMQRIATVTMFIPEFRRESEANARLIAAAPDLLEAVKLLVHSADAKSYWVGRAAIAKATEGKSNG